MQFQIYDAAGVSNTAFEPFPIGGVWRVIPRLAVLGGSTMRRIFTALSIITALAGLAGSAQAQDLRDFCPDRPGLGTPACIVDAGHVAVEIGGVDWTLERSGDARIDTIIAGDALVRVGLTGTLEAQIGWSAFGTVRTRDRATGAVTRQSGTGDVFVALRQNVSHPGGEGFSAAVMPFATLPTGGSAIGAGDWGAGVIVPLSYSLSDTLSLAASPQVEAAVDEDGDGRHLAYGSVIGLNLKLTKKLTTALEFQATRDEDPAGHATERLASLSFAWQPKDDLQFDIGGVAGLNHASPDVELYVGIARRF